MRLLPKISNSRYRVYVAKPIAFMSFIFPIKNDYIAWANYHSNFISQAKRCSPKGMSNALKLKILYQEAKQSEQRVSELFSNERQLFNENINHLNYSIIFHYVKYCYDYGVNFYDLSEIVGVKGSKVKKRFVTYCIYYFYNRFPNSDFVTSYYDDYKALKSLSKCVSNIGDRAYKPFEDSAFLELNPLINLLSNCKHDATLTSELLKHVPESKQMQFIQEYSYLLSRREVFDVLRSEGKLQEEFLNRKNPKAIKLLDYAISIGDKESYNFIYKKVKPNSLKHYMWFLFLNDKHFKIMKIAKTLSKLRLDSLYDSCLYIIYLSIVSVDAKFALEFIRDRKARRLNVSSYQVLNSLYEGQVIQAEIYRAELDRSLEAYLNCLYPKITHQDLVGNSKVLLIAEQGVADEVRWARLYSRIQSNNVSITCDHRFYELFQRSFPHIEFIPLNRVFRKPRHLTVEEFHQGNLPDDDGLGRYSCVSSTSMLFTVLPESEIHTKGESYLKFENFPLETARKKVGILWSSSFSSGLRGHRYGIDKEHYLGLINRNPHFEYYCLQSPISEDDKNFCIEHGIQIVKNVDLYNDFDNSSSFLGSLDCVVGPSSLNTELSAACGTRFFHIANAAEVALMRNGSVTTISTHDQLSENTITVYPIHGYGERSNFEITNDCFEHLEGLLNEI